MRPNNKLILSNALFLMVRSVVTIVIGLLASRILLEKLGIEDYGVYYIVGGIVVMFNSLRTFFSSSIQRFLNYAKGLGDELKLNRIFNVGFEIQLALAVFFLILMETLGLFFFLHLNLTEGQFSDGIKVFHLSVITALVSILTVPYDALIIANERMNVYALFSMIDSALRLLIVYFISMGPFGNIVNYAILLLAVSVVIGLLNVSYCSRSFKEAKLHFVMDKGLMKEMGEFAGWNFFGNIGFSLTHEGVNYLLNLIGGVVVNAARAIVYQIMSGLNLLVSNVCVAFNPQTNASFANQDKQPFYNLLCYEAKIMLAFYLIVAVPFAIYSRPIILIWLGHIPDYVISFVLSILVYHLFHTMRSSIDLFYKSIGELKYYQIIEFFVLALNIPLAYFLLHQGAAYWSVFIGMAFLDLIEHICIVALATVKYNFPIRMFLAKVYMPFVSIILPSVSIVYLALTLKIDESPFCYSVVSFFFIETAYIVMIYYLIFNKAERRIVTKTINDRYFKK